MNASRTISLVIAAILFSLSSAASPADELPKDEEVKIKALISHVESLNAAKFIRNGKSYDAATAAKFLRGKWKANADDIDSASEFIDLAATFSGTTGKKYVIALSNGEETLCADYLKAELQKIEMAGNR